MVTTRALIHISAENARADESILTPTFERAFSIAATAIFVTIVSAYCAFVNIKAHVIIIFKASQAFTCIAALIIDAFGIGWTVALVNFTFIKIFAFPDDVPSAV